MRIALALLAVAQLRWTCGEEVQLRAIATLGTGEVRGFYADMVPLMNDTVTLEGNVTIKCVLSSRMPYISVMLDTFCAANNETACFQRITRNKCLVCQPSCLYEICDNQCYLNEQIQTKVNIGGIEGNFTMVLDRRYPRTINTTKYPCSFGLFNAIGENREWPSLYASYFGNNYLSQADYILLNISDNVSEQSFMRFPLTRNDSILDGFEWNVHRIRGDTCAEDWHIFVYDLGIITPNTQYRIGSRSMPTSFITRITIDTDKILLPSMLFYQLINILPHSCDRDVLPSVCWLPDNASVNDLSTIFFVFAINVYGKMIKIPLMDFITFTNGRWFYTVELSSSPEIILGRKFLYSVDTAFNPAQGIIGFKAKKTVSFIPRQALDYLPCEIESSNCPREKCTGALFNDYNAISDECNPSTNVILLVFGICIVSGVGELMGLRQLGPK